MAQGQSGHQPEIGVNSVRTDSRSGHSDFNYEQIFTRLFEAAGHGIAFLGLDGRWTRANEALCQMVGYSAVELCGKPFDSITHPDDAEPGRRRFEQMRSGKTSSYLAAKRYIRKDGREIPVILSATAIRDAAGAPVHIMTHIVDATAQVKAQTKIRTLMYAIDESPVATAIADTAGNIVYSNPVFSAVTGYDATDGAAAIAGILGDGDSPRDVDPQAWRSVFSGSPWRGEFLARRKDGTSYWCDLDMVAVRGADDAVRFIACFLSDITARKVAEAALLETNMRLRGILDSATCGIIVLDSARRINSFNPAAAHMFGYTAEEAIGQDFGILFAESDTTANAARGDIGGLGQNQALIASGKRDVTCRRKCGEEFEAELSISELDLQDRKTAVSVIADLTERKRAERQLQQAVKMEAVGQLTGGIAHDFNNHLGIVLGNLQLLRRRIVDAPNLNEFIQAASEAALRAADLTKRLLAFSRGQSRAPLVIDTHELVVSMNQLLRRTIPGSVEISTSLKADPATVRADPSELQSALLNLIINARDAMNGAGRLRIATSNVEADPDYVRRHIDAREGRYVCLSVTDTGSGIPPNLLSRIFEPFFTTKAAGRGTGLGLSMVYAFVRGAGGHILVDSEEGKGTRFAILLPAIDAPREWAADDDEILPEGDETFS